MKRTAVLLLTVYCLLFTVRPVSHAAYVLPYPSYMPGNKLYQVMRVVDWFKKYWFWGNLAQVKYHQALADKYLVEAKTLFEYKQYLLATDAITRSDKQIADISQFIPKAAKLGIDTKQVKENVSEEMLVHLSVLETIKQQLPDEFVWKPEKAKPIDLPIGAMLDASIDLRKKIYSVWQNEE